MKNKSNEVLKVKDKHDYSIFFVVSAPEKCVIEFEETEKAYKKIARTAKVGSIFLNASLCAIPATIITAPFQISELTAGIGAAMLAGMAVGIGLNRVSKKMHDNFVHKNGLTDYINYVVYKENKKLKGFLKETEDNFDGLREQVVLIKNNLNHLVDLQLKTAIQIGLIECYAEDLMENYEGNLNKVIEMKRDNTSGLLNNYDYIAKQISANKDLYYAVVPELKQNIDYCVEHVAKLEKIEAAKNSQEYYDKRLELEFQSPVANQFNEEQTL